MTFAPTNVHLALGEWTAEDSVTATMERDATISLASAIACQGSLETGLVFGMTQYTNNL